MKHSKNIAIIATALIASMGSAFAQSQSYDPNNPVWQPESAEHQTQPNSSQKQTRAPMHQDAQNHGQPNQQPIHQGQQAHEPQGRPSQAHQDNRQPYGQPSEHRANEHFSVGDRLPKDYRGKDHRVNYKTHGLPAPARNQAWVEADGRYLLVNILTNAIVQVLLNN